MKEWKIWNLNFCTITISEDRNIVLNVSFLDYNNVGKAKFSWKTNTTGLFLKEHVFNISILSTNGTIIQQKHNIKIKEVECSGLDQYTNYTFIIQSKNKYTYSAKPLEFKFLTYGENIQISFFSLE